MTPAPRIVWVTVLVDSIIALTAALVHTTAILVMIVHKDELRYDFHRYGQLLYGVVWVAAGLACVRAGGGGDQRSTAGATSIGIAHRTSAEKRLH